MIVRQKKGEKRMCNEMKAYAVSKGVKLAEVCKMLGIHKNTITRWIRSGKNTEMIRTAIDAIELSQSIRKETEPS